MKISKNRYLQGFGIVVLLLALVESHLSGVAKPKIALWCRLILRSVGGEVGCF